MPERFTMPIIDSEDIDPRENLPEETKKKIEETKERQAKRKDSLINLFRDYYGGGDAHVHSYISSTPEEKFIDPQAIYHPSEIKKWAEKIGHEFCAITDHTSNPSNPRELNPDDEICQKFLRQAEEIRQMNESADSDFAMLSGCETNIMLGKDGRHTLDMPSEILQQLDLVIASRHNGAGDKSISDLEKTFMAAAENPNVDVIGHPDRHVEFYPHDWKFFCNQNEDANNIQKEISDLKKAQKKEGIKKEEKEKIEQELQVKYKVLKKIIGKIPIEEGDDPQISKLNDDFNKKEQEYSGMWDRVMDKMKENNIAFEINMKSLPVPRLLEKARDKGLDFFINFDFHDILELEQKKKHSKATSEEEQAIDRRGKNELLDTDEQVLKDYKQKRLSQGPGITPIRMLAERIKSLKKMGITPDKVINSSKQRLSTFLTEKIGKETENLQFLSSK